MADPSALPPGFVLDASPTTASVPAPIIPRTPAPQTPAQASKDTADAVKSQNDATVSGFKVKEEGITEQRQQAQKDMGAEGANDLIASLERARGFVNNWSTGWAGAALQHLPATDAAKLQNILDTEVKGNVFLNTLNQRQQDNPNPAGGNSTPGGRILQSEVPMITQSLAALDPVKLGPQELLNSINQAEYRTLRVKAILNGEDPSDPAVQKKYGIDKIAAMLPKPDASDGGNTNPPPPGVSNLSPDQKKAYDAFLVANPNPTGKQIGDFLGHLTGQTVTNGDDIAKAINQGRGINSTVENTTEEKNVRDTIAAEDQHGINQTDPTTRVLVHGATLGLSDEASGVGNAAANVLTSPFTGKFDPVGSYEVGRDVERQRLADAQGKLGVAAGPVEFAGSMLSGNPEGAVAKITAEPTISQIVRQGAKSGGAYGLVSGYGNGQGFTNSVVGAGVGGVTGAVFGAAGGRLLAGRTPPTVPPGAPTASDIAGAVSAEGIPAARPIADPTVRGKMAYLETTRGGHGPVQDSLSQTRQAIADKVAGLTGDGSASAPGVAGQAVQDAGIRTLDDAKSAAQGVYKQAEATAGNTPITPTLALSKLDSYIDKLSRNPETNSGVIDYLKGIRSDLAVPDPAPTNTGVLDQSGNPIMRQTPAQPKTLADLRDIMTGANDRINFQNLQKTRAEGIMFDVGKSLKQDISGALQDANPQALGLYNKADGMWSDMSKLRQQVVQRLVGPADNPLSGEQTMSRVTAMMSNKGDLGRFNRTMNMMTPEEQANFRASLWENIGQRSPEEGFTPGAFLAQTKNMQVGALKSVFGEDGAQSVQNLRVASRGLMDTQSALNNSRSGFVSNFKDALGSILTLKHTGATGLGYAVAGVPGAIAGAGVGEVAQRAFNGLSARSLMNTDVSSWIRKAATVKTTAQAQAMIGKLNGIAAGNAALQPEISGLRDALTRAMNDNAPAVGSAAASPDQRPNQQ